MRFALINPPWTFDGSLHVGCREPHLPLEYGYAKALLSARGHEAEIIDGHMQALTLSELAERIVAFKPDFSVVTTAPSYLFWRCAPPDLRVPAQVIDRIRGQAGKIVVVGPHASMTPATTIKRLDADAAVLGECEDVLPLLGERSMLEWSAIDSLAYRVDGELVVQGTQHVVELETLPALSWSRQTIGRHGHHHQRFEAVPIGPGAEMEASRGFHNLRNRPIDTVLAEIDLLIERGVEYVYFIDEIFRPQRRLLEALIDRPIKLGVKTRIDLWTPELLELLGAAGCVSIEAGVESTTEEGRELLIYAKRRVPFVEANLLEATPFARLERGARHAG